MIPNRRKRILILLLLSPVFLLLLFPFIERLRGHVALTRFKRHLASRGFKLTMAEFKSPRPTGENGARAFFQAARQLRSNSVLVTNPPPRMQVTPSGRAIVGFREEEWVEYKCTNRWSEIAADLEQNEATLQVIRTALAKTVFDNDVDLTAGSSTVFVHRTPPKTASQWFAVQAQLCLHQGQNKEALENLIAESRLTRVLEQDHILISELVRIAIASISRTTVWEALQAEGWTDSDLAQLSEAWQSTCFATNMTHDLEGELIFGLSEYDAMRTSNSNAVNAIYGMQTFAPPADSDRAESEKSLSAIEADLLRIVEPDTHRSFYNDLRYPQNPYFGALANSLRKSMKAETERSLVLTAISLKRYGLRSGNSPPTLQSLVPEFLPSVPIDYMDGQPIKYRLEPDNTSVLYSVGEDYKDDGGDASALPGKTGTRNIWNRKDLVWPQPASPEEIEMFRKEKRAGK